MSTRVFLGNLPFNLTDSNELRTALVDLGYSPAEVKVVTDRETGQGRGFAFVEMETPQAATDLIGTINGQYVLGRPVRADKADAKPGRPPANGGGGGGGRSAPPRDGGYGGEGGGRSGKGGRGKRDDSESWREDRRRSNKG